MFESFANSKRYKTNTYRASLRLGLRALLIQKDTKQRKYEAFNNDSLRALLIQKDTKLNGNSWMVGGV